MVEVKVKAEAYLGEGIRRSRCYVLYATKMEAQSGTIIAS
jgi:hypothetical protein